MVHRLDMDTSGVMVFARNFQATKRLYDTFHAKNFDGSGGSGDGGEFVWKTYEALVHGNLPVAEGEINLTLVRILEHLPFMRVYTRDDTDRDGGVSSSALPEGIELGS